MPQIFQDALGEVLRTTGDLQPASLSCATGNPTCSTGCNTGCHSCGGSGCHVCWNTGTALAGNTGLVQYNNQGCLDGIPFSYYANGNFTLGNVGNVKLLGGANTNVLKTDGTGNIYWSTDRIGEVQPDIPFTASVTGNNLTYTHPNISSFSNMANLGGGTANTYASVYRNGILVPSSDYVIQGNVLTMNVNTFAGDIITIGATGANSSVVSPGGLNQQIQFNNFGEFGGVAVATYDGNIMTIQYLSAGNTNINNVLDPINPQDAATKAYVDSMAQGLNVLQPVQAATTADLAGVYNNGIGGVGATITLPSALTTLDGVTLGSLDRILVKDQTNPLQNGVYYLDPTLTILTRVPDADTSSELDKGTFVFVEEGLINGAGGFVEQNNITQIGVDNVVWNQFSSAGKYSASNNVILVGSDFQLPVQPLLTPGTYGNSTVIPVITVNEFGVVSNISIANVQLGNIANINLNGNVDTYLNGEGNWVALPGSGTVTDIGTTTNGGNVNQLGFQLTGGNITTTGVVDLVVPTALQLAANMGLGNLAYANFTGDPTVVLYGNGVWASAGSGTVTRVGTQGSGLGFSLTGGNITTTGDVILTVPSAPTLTSALGYGNIVYSNYNGNGSTVLTGSGVWAPYNGGGGGNTLPGGSPTQLQYNANGTFGGITATSYDGSKLTLGSNSQVKITGGTSGQLLTTDGLGNLSWVSVNAPTGNIVNINLDGNVSNVLKGDGTWGPGGSGTGTGTVTQVGGTGSGLGFNLSGLVTSSGNLTLQTPTVTDLRSTLGIGNVANANFNGDQTQFLRGDGTWVTPASAGVGTVTSVGTAGSGLGFSLTGGTITSAGIVTLNVPSNTALVNNLGLGNIVYSNLDGNVSNVYRGDGTWGPSSSGSAAGSNSQVQFNNNGSFGADSGFTYNSITDTLTVANAVNMGGITGLKYGVEVFNGTASVNGTQNLDVLNSSTLYGIVNSTANIVINVRGNSTTTLNSMLGNYNSIVVAAYLQSGTTPYGVVNLTIDNVAYPISWVNKTTPTPLVNTLHNYTFQIIKTSATPTYKVLGSMTPY